MSTAVRNNNNNNNNNNNKDCLLQTKDPQKFEITVRRTNVMEDSFNSISKAKPNQLRSRFWVNFAGEHGYDYGGLAR